MHAQADHKSRQGLSFHSGRIAVKQSTCNNRVHPASACSSLSPLSEASVADLATSCMGCPTGSTARPRHHKCHHLSSHENDCWAQATQPVNFLSTSYQCQPASRLSRKSGSLPASKSASRPTRQPGSQAAKWPADRTASGPASQLSKQAASQHTSHPGSQRASSHVG